jgi:putative ABC transport system permease protein
MGTHIRELFERIFSIFHKRELDDDFNEELSSHIEMATEDNIQEGMSPQEARRQALIRFGGVEVARELHRDARGLPLIEKIMLDVRYAFRMFRKNPGFSLAVIITLALCIGANTAIFSMLYALIFKPLPFPEPDRIVSIYNVYNAGLNKFSGTNIIQYLDFKENADAFEGLAIFQSQEFNMVLGDDAFRYTGAAATSGIFDVLGLKPIQGRFFSKENDRTGDRREIVLTHRFWKSHFQEDPGVIGHTIQVDSEIYEIVGIAPEVFVSFNALPQFIVSMRWAPQQTKPERRYFYMPASLLGRLKPDKTMGAAADQMTALERHALDNASAEIQAERDRYKFTISMDTLQSSRVEPDLRLKLYLLQGAVLFVLLIGCVNVTNLFLSRSNARQGELAVRVALGSGRRAIARQLFVESFILTGIGATLGIVFAIGIIKTINVFTAQLLPQSLPFSIDSWLLAFTALIAILISLVIGLFQVFHVFSSNLLTLTKNQSGHTSSGRSLHTMSGGLVVAQMAITLVLLIGGGLLIRSFANLVAVDPGFNPQHLITACIALSSDYQRDNRDQKFRQQLEDRLREIPDFSSTSLNSSIPYNEGPWLYARFQLEDYEQPDITSLPLVFGYGVDSSYLETMKIPLIEGRWFNAGDTNESGPVCVVSQDFVHQNFSGRSAVGKHGAFPTGPGEKQNWMEIIGVIGQVREFTQTVQRRGTFLPAIYIPVQQKKGALFDITIAIRSPRTALEVIALVQEKVKELDTAIPLYRIGTMEEIISTSFIERRMIMLLLCSFAGIALILSAVGIYGVLAYDVSKRTHEIGIRGAIGATDKQIIIMVLRQGLWNTGIGLLIGIVGAFYLSRFMTSLLFEVKPIDPLTFVLVPVLLLVVAALASYIPARQASRVDPALALRAE